MLAFPDGERLLQLAEHVATRTRGYKARRPALHDFLAGTVPDEIRQAIISSK